MNIAILYFGNPFKPEIDRFLTAGQKTGHNVKVIFANKSDPYLESLDKFDCIIPRPWIVDNIETELAPLKRLESLGIPVINSFDSICKAKNKATTLDLLAKENIPITESITINNLDYSNNLNDFIFAAQKLGGFPLVAKNPFGTYGEGVILVKNLASARDTLSTWLASSGSILIQKYYSEAKGKDTRVLVIGDKVIGAMERQAKDGEFRSNIELGGTPFGVPQHLLPSSYATLALRATKALNLQIAGVDILESKTGPLVIEINSNPGFARVFEQSTGIDVASAIIKFACECCEKASPKVRK